MPSLALALALRHFTTSLVNLADHPGATLTPCGTTSDSKRCVGVRKAVSGSRVFCGRPLGGTKKLDREETSNWSGAQPVENLVDGEDGELAEAAGCVQLLLVMGRISCLSLKLIEAATTNGIKWR